MRLHTVFISTAFALAGMSAALAVEKENMLVARFADSGFLAKVEARVYEEEPEFYARGHVLSKLSSGRNRPGNSRLTSYRPASESSVGTSMIGFPSSSRTVSTQSDYSGTTLRSSSYHPSLSRTGSTYSGTTAAYSNTPRYRRSLYEPSEISRRDQRKARYGFKFYN